MKKLLYVACSFMVGAVLCGIQAAGADSKWYVRFDAGIAFQQDIKIKNIDGVGLPISVEVTEADIEDIAGLLDELDIELPEDVEILPGTYTIGKPKISTDPGVRFDLAGGYMLTKSLAAEIEVGFVYNSIDKLTLEGSCPDPVGTVTATAKVDGSYYQIPIFANLLYKLPLESKFKPYLGAGVGGVFSIADIGSLKDLTVHAMGETYTESGELRVSESESDFTFAYQGTVGCSYEIKENMELGIAYKFLGTLDHEFGDVKTDPVYTHSVLVAFTYRF